MHLRSMNDKIIFFFSERIKQSNLTIIMKPVSLHDPRDYTYPLMNFSNQTLDYNESLEKKKWISERKHADLILASCRRFKLNLKLDRLTRGEGNCFMVAVLQQLRRPEVYENLRV